MFREGLKKILGLDFDIVSYFEDVPEFLASGAEVDLVIVDEEASKDLALLKSEKPGLNILKLGLENNVSSLISENAETAQSGELLAAIKGIEEKLSGESGLESWD